MSRNGNEEHLVTETTEILSGLGDVVDTEVLAAGVFSLANLMAAHAVGAATGAGAASLADASPLGSGVSAALGARIATETAAAAQGTSVRLLVAVTNSAIHVLNTESDRLEAELARFDRSTVEVTVKKLGLSRVVELLDPASGAGISLHGSVSPISAQSKPDKLVLQLLT